jgi:hypothetical protein
MPELPKPKRHALKMEPDDPMLQLERLIRSFDRMAEGLENMVSALDELTFTDADGRRHMRVSDTCRTA